MTTDPVARVAALAEADPHFLAFALADYAASEGLDDAELAARLGCPVDRLPHVKLCPAPLADPAGFRAAVVGVAEAFGLDAAALAAAVRHGQAVAAPPDPAPDDAAHLLAARDRTP
jgi:hypothetical protein